MHYNKYYQRRAVTILVVVIIQEYLYLLRFLTRMFFECHSFERTG